MNTAQAYEVNLYWRCACGYENTSLWFYEGNSSYRFTCGGCGENSRILPPPQDDPKCSTCRFYDNGWCKKCPTKENEYWEAI